VLQNGSKNKVCSLRGPRLTDLRLWHCGSLKTDDPNDARITDRGLGNSGDGTCDFIERRHLSHSVSERRCHRNKRNISLTQPANTTNSSQTELQITSRGDRQLRHKSTRFSNRFLRADLRVYKHSVVLASSRPATTHTIRTQTLAGNPVITSNNLQNIGKSRSKRKLHHRSYHITFRVDPSSNQKRP